MATDLFELCKMFNKLCLVARLLLLFLFCGGPETDFNNQCLCMLLNSCYSYSDNGPQFSSEEMKEFAEAYGFHHITTNPYYPQVNGQEEHTVCTMKHLLCNAKIHAWYYYISYCAMPLEWCGPTTFLMGCKILPQPKSIYIPSWTHI